MNKQTPIDRLNYSGTLGQLVDSVCKNYGIGNASDSSLVEVGYEDCNVMIKTSDATYLAKIFSKRRTAGDIARYSTIMEKVVEAGVSHPPLIQALNGGFVSEVAEGVSAVLMKFIEGKTFLELDRAPNDGERRAVVEQAVKINAVKHHPSYLFDSWAIPNIQGMFERVKDFIAPEDLPLVIQALALYKEVPISDLPHCFVHGDFTKANVLKGDDGKIYILDFSVANWYPRIQELAVISANLLHDTANPMSLREKCGLVANEYSTMDPLIEAERNNLYNYAIAAVAMEFMGAHQEKYINGNDNKETEYWLSLGREGLRKELI